MIDGIRFINPEAIRRWAIYDSRGGCFYAGCWQNMCIQMATWTTVPKLRREFDSYDEAAIEAAMLIEMRMADNRALDVVQVVIV